MNAGQPLVAAVLVKIHEQLERTGHLIRRLPDDRLDWTPLDGAWPAGLLVGHLLECVAGICAVPTVFVLAGESILTLLLGNLEHLINHKHQLFTYLKLMGIGVDSGDLYQFRGGVE